jgi:flagellar M-ring protein FliF
MAQPLEAFLKQWQSLWGGLSPSRRAGLIMTTVLLLGGFALLVFWGGRPSFRPLFSNLGEEEAAAIVERLRERKVQYRIGNGGRSVEVPEEQLYELRLALATEGLPIGGGVGFELFDRTSFGATEFVQKVNLQRALQGELARTIKQFPQVCQARVHLSVPERSVFVREPQRPQATVVVQLHPGATLQQSQLQGIVHLVSSSVQSMQPQDVHVVDTTGKVLYSPRDGQDGEMASGRILQRQAEMERRLEAKILGILEPVTGPQKVVARVHVDLDPRQVEQTEEQYDPDKSAVRSEQRSTERSSGASGGVGGVPGVMSNLQESKPQASSSQSSSYQRENETVNYEVNRLTRRTVASAGELRRITVAVLVDGVKQAAGGSDSKETVVPRPAEELKQYEEIVKQAIGFNAQRGDVVQVASVPFERVQSGAEEATGMFQVFERWSSTPLVRHAFVLVLGVLFLLGVVRPFARGVITAVQTRPRMLPTELPRTVGEMEALSQTGRLVSGGEVAEGSKAALPVEVVRMAEMDPQRFAAALKAWMRQGD